MKYRNGEKSMKYQKLINELDSLLDSTSKQCHKRQDELNFFLRQLKAEKKKLLKKLERQNSKTMRRKLKKDLGLIESAYASLGALT
ncbi:MAG: hypothetical protein OI74_13550 [Gammaproteobacteria bacterium (ex Lamellibrachia satsuma)]|nr:MAG: hypothetical protein OI74_13550 [Gammaproteobacteria bacterium (ex Lamellibrachia satsuma)]RRS36147.1 MAG: hypothetical protein NV67_08570 [Gammaproteobacteria bacterium (ex Lamellibrachia satsuma)]